VERGFEVASKRMDALRGVAEPAAVLPRSPSVADTGVEKDRRRFARATHVASIVVAGSPVGGASVVIGSRSHSHERHAQELDAYRAVTVTLADEPVLFAMSTAFAWRV
jgi:hypothetical protein